MGGIGRRRWWLWFQVRRALARIPKFHRSHVLKGQAFDRCRMASPHQEYYCRFLCAEIFAIRADWEGAEAFAQSQAHSYLELPGSNSSLYPIGGACWCLLFQGTSLNSFNFLQKFKFNPTNPNLIAAGCINGQIVIWDIAEHKERLVQEKAQSKKKTSLFGEKVGPETPIIMWKAVSSIENGHKGAVTQINVNIFSYAYRCWTVYSVGSSWPSSNQKWRLGKSSRQRAGTDIYDLLRWLIRNLGLETSAGEKVHDAVEEKEARCRRSAWDRSLGTS